MAFMDFGLSEEEEMILESARSFAHAELIAGHRVHEAQGDVSSQARAAFDETGLAELAALDGDGAMPVSWPARALTLAALASADGAAALDLWRGWIPSAAARLGAPQDAGFLELTESLDALQWPLPCLPMGDGDRLLILARSGAWGLAEVSAAPVRSLGLAAAGMARCELSAWIARGEAGATLAQEIAGQARLWAASLLVGIAQGCVEYVARYVQERVAFGKALAQHQGIAFLFAEMATGTEGARLLTLRAAWDAEHGRWGAATDAFLEAAEVALEVTSRGVQLLGGHGYMQDHPVEKWMRDARALSLLWGGVDLALEEVAS